jgi:hypothetical protein
MIFYGVWLRSMHRLLDKIACVCVFGYGIDWAVTGSLQ